MIFAASGRVHGPRSKLFSTLETPRHVKTYKKIVKPFSENSMLGDLESFEIRNLKAWKRRAPTIPENPSHIFLETAWLVVSPPSGMYVVLVAAAWRYALLAGFLCFFSAGMLLLGFASV